MKIIAFHSYKGGTGKTHLSANLATVLARKGFKTVLLDLDFRGPNLQDTASYNFVGLIFIVKIR